MFFIYIIGRGITIIEGDRLWKDKTYTGYRNYNVFNIIESVSVNNNIFNKILYMEC